LSNTTVPMTGVEGSASEVEVATPAKLAEALARTGQPTGVEIIHGTDLRDQVIVRIPSQTIVVDPERGVTIGGRPAGPETYLDLYNEGRVKAGMKPVKMEQLYLPG